MTLAFYLICSIWTNRQRQDPYLDCEWSGVIHVFVCCCSQRGANVRKVFICGYTTYKQVVRWVRTAYLFETDACKSSVPVCELYVSPDNTVNTNHFASLRQRSVFGQAVMVTWSKYLTDIPPTT